jgi:hypothetical protein
MVPLLFFSTVHIIGQSMKSYAWQIIKAGNGASIFSLNYHTSMHIFVTKGVGY